MKKKKVKKTKTEKEIEIADKRREKIEKIDFRWPIDESIYKRYTLRCQKCGERIPMEIRYSDEALNATKKLQKKLKTSMVYINDANTMLNGALKFNMVYAKIPTRQFKSKKNETWASPLEMITFELNDYKKLLDAYWYSHAKSFVQRLYKKCNNPNHSIKGIICDNCYELEKLKE